MVLANDTPALFYSLFVTDDVGLAVTHSFVLYSVCTVQYTVTALLFILSSY